MMEASQSADPLSEMLSALHMRSSVLGLFGMEAPWGFDHPELDGVICHVVLRGRCVWSGSDGAWTTLEEGDCLVLPQGRAHRLASAPNAVCVPMGHVLAEKGFRVWRPSDVAGVPVRQFNLTANEATGGAVVMDIVSRFGYGHSNLLLDALPASFVVHKQHMAPSLWSNFLPFVLQSGDMALSPGYSALVSRIADVLFLFAIRGYLRGAGDKPAGVLVGLSDPKIARALNSMHKQPAHGWSVAELAQVAGMSRAQFAEQFVARMGLTPIGYLRAWRMHLAMEDLAAGVPIKIICGKLGYASPISFARSFKRVAGQTPAAFRSETMEGAGTL